MADFKEPQISEHTADSPEVRRPVVNSRAAIGTRRAKSVSPGIANRNGKDVGSWDAYRNWLTKVQAPNNRRSMPDVALFSWKGYRSWADKVRRDWDDAE
jgi:hypothetical protein